MRIALTGASGIVGGFVLAFVLGLLAQAPGVELVDGVLGRAARLVAHPDRADDAVVVGDHDDRVTGRAQLVDHPSGRVEGVLADGRDDDQLVRVLDGGEPVRGEAEHQHGTGPEKGFTEIRFQPAKARHLMASVADRSTADQAAHRVAEIAILEHTDTGAPLTGSGIAPRIVAAHRTRDELGPDAEVRSFAIVDGVITEEPVHILED